MDGYNQELYQGAFSTFLGIGNMGRMLSFVHSKFCIKTFLLCSWSKSMDQTLEFTPPLN